METLVEAGAIESASSGSPVSPARCRVVSRTEDVARLIAQSMRDHTDENPYRDLQTFTVAAVMAGWVVPARLTERVLRDIETDR